jgi:autotransporter-associated beta strand protein
VISGNQSDGVQLFGAGTEGNLLQGNFIGTDSTGTLNLRNRGNGVTISSGASGNTIGGRAAGARNVISGNQGNGVLITDTGTSGNVVQGNFIGINAAGAAILPNGNSGVSIISASNNLIGGGSVGAGNVISGNVADGVVINGSGAIGNLVLGNFIGTNPAGTSVLSNSGDGITIGSGAANNTIGGALFGTANIISGNRSEGVLITKGTTGNLVEGNYIGTDVIGTTPLSNADNGVVISGGAANNTIGGTMAGARNVISGNHFDGVAIFNSGTTGNLVQGNYIGTDVTGTTALGNGDEGVIIFGSAANNTIGGTATGARNLISGNGIDGVDILDSGTTDNVVQGNYIGTNSTGTIALGNGDAGVLIGVAIGDPSNNIVGGTAGGAGNVISGNQGDGVQLFGAGTDGNLVQGNFIGTDSTGTLNLGNRGNGVTISSGASGNTIGGPPGGGSNTINFNGGDGLHLDAATGSVTTIEMNFSSQRTNIVSGTLQVGMTNAIPATSAVLVSAAGILDLNNFSDAIGSLAGAGTAMLGSGMLTSGYDNTSTTFSGVIRGTGALTKTGTGTLTLTGNNRYGTTTISAGTLQVGAGGDTGTLGSGSVTDNGALSFALSNRTTVANAISGTGTLTQAGSSTTILTGTNSYSGDTTVAAGTLLVNGVQPSSNVTVIKGATLGGSGTVGAIIATGTVSPGDPAGTAILSSGNATFNAGSSFAVILNGSPGTGYGRLNSTGTVDLSGSPTLNVSVSSTVPFGTSFTIISAGTIIGNFRRLLNNAVLLAGNQAFLITYNDTTVVLTRGQGGTNTSLVASANSSVPYQPVNFTAIVTPVVPSEVTPTGTVQFRIGGRNIGNPVPLSTTGGIATATYTIWVSSVDGQTVGAVYSGDSNFLGSTASLDPNIFFVTELYRDVLRREPDDAGLQAWVGQLHAGMSRTQVVMDFWVSREHREKEVLQFYNTILHRQLPPTEAERRRWVDQLMAGMSEFQVAIEFVTSPEYTAEHLDDKTFVNGLYSDLLKRLPESHPASDQEVNSWLQTLQNGASRDLVAASFLSSSEAFQKAIDDYYFVFLCRQESQQELQAWLAVLETGRATPLSVASAFLASNEYLARALNGATSSQ